MRRKLLNLVPMFTLLMLLLPTLAAAVILDADSDGVPDVSDNCTLVANSDQLDTDQDGFGNRCDADYNQDKLTNFGDLARLKASFFKSDANLDLTGDGSVNFADLAVLKSFFFKQPGPSGLSCAGVSTPCAAEVCVGDGPGKQCHIPGVCGNLSCEASETAASCPADCFEKCYGAEAICKRKFFDVFLAGTHNADVSYYYPTYDSVIGIFNTNQSKSLTQQLDDGIRYLALDIDYCTPGASSGAVCLCHGEDTCLIGGWPADQSALGKPGGLQEIRTWLDAHPSEVIVLAFENYLSYADLVAVLQRAGLDRDAYHLPLTLPLGPLDDPWPFTWNDMARRHNRVVIATSTSPAAGETRVDWIIDDNYADQATPFGTNLSDDWKCRDTVNSNSLYGVNHTRSGLGGQGDSAAAECANDTDNIERHVKKCEAASGRKLNYAEVDFYENDAGPLAIANRMNGINHITVPYSDDFCDCHTSADCASSDYCALTFCTAKLGTGSPCVDSGQCTSGLCHAGLCSDCDTSTDCGPNQFCLVTCNDKVDNGVPCLQNNYCKSGICNYGFCIGSPQPGGTPCTTGAACNSGSCSTGFCDTTCGDGVCEAINEVCGDSNNQGLECISDCGKCGNDHPCFDNTTCSSGICNYGFCIASAQPGGTPCTTSAACQSGSCTAGFCDTSCGDGKCEAINEVCGDSNNQGLECTTDCGKCGNGHPCFDNTTCASGVCNYAVCIANRLGNGAACSSDNSCASGLCNFGFCSAGDLSAGTPCTTSRACHSGNCTAGLCIQRCGDLRCDGTESCGGSNSGIYCTSDCGKCSNGHACVSDSQCSSNFCYLLTCRNACKTSTQSCSSDGECCSNTCVNYGFTKACL